MSYRTEDGKFRKPQEIPPPTVSEQIKNRKYWQKKTMTMNGTKKFFDQDVRTGICYFCKKEGRPQRSVTYLHHVKYDNSDPLAWTVEVCSKCHFRIDPYNQKQVNRHYGRKPRMKPKPSAEYYEWRKNFAS